MSLHDALRKAASLIVELPPAPEVGTEPTTDITDTVTERDPHKPIDVDALLAAQGIGRNANKTAAPPATKTVEEIVRDADGPNLEDIKTSVEEAAPVAAAANGLHDAATIYRAANLPAASYSAEQMLELLGSLPAELPLDTRRKTVKVMLQSLGQNAGATPESIVADASRKMAALAAYSDYLQRRTEEFAATAEKEIAELQAKIEAKRLAVQNAREHLAKSNQMCTAESERLDDVLEFFSLDVPPSKYATEQK